LTLIELMVVMVIMVLMTAVTAPSMVVAYREARIRSATRQVVARLNYGRSRAVTSRTTTRFNARQSDETGRAPIVVWVTVQKEGDPNAASTTTAEPSFEEDTTPSGRLRELPAGVTLTLLKKESQAPALPDVAPEEEEEESVDTVTFWRNGQTEDALLVLSDPEGKKRYVRLEALTGRTKLLAEEELADDTLVQEYLKD
jgi:type II secretory pathway pseudopilin PulG